MSVISVSDYISPNILRGLAKNPEKKQKTKKLCVNDRWTFFFFFY
jgi:hypothetical protein